MPGNEVGDRVHNFFAQDKLSQGQPHSQVVDGSWPVLNNNLWVGNQKQVSVPSSNPKNYNLHQSDIESFTHPLHVPNGLSSTQSTLRPEFAKSQSQSELPNLNGYIYGRQVIQTRQDETNVLGVDTESDRHNLTSRSLSTYESQQGNGPEHHRKTSGRSETSEYPVSFDFFGGLQQMSGQQPGMLQSLPQQQSGLNEMHQLQQEVIFRKMQELQRQQQLQQLDAKQQNSRNQSSSFARQESGNHSNAFINGTSVSDASTYPWAADLAAGNTDLLQRASPSMQGSSIGLVFSPEQGQTSRLIGLVPQQVDQSLYGVPISGSRGNVSQYSHIATDKSSMPQLSSFSNSFPGNQYAAFPDQVSMQDGISITTQGLEGKILFGHASGQGLNSRINMENIQQVHALQRNAPLQEFQGRQKLAGPSTTLKEKITSQVSSSQNEVPLDPTEEKILFGSDDNIWDAFGKSTNSSGGAFNLLDGMGSLNGLPSVQSGSWSALMQSAVAETSSSDIRLQEEWSGLSFQNAEVPTVNHQPSTYNDGRKQQTALADNNLQITSAPSSRSVPLSDNANMTNNYCSVAGYQQFGQKHSYEHGQRLQSDSSQAPIQQSSEGGSNWFNRGTLGMPLAKGSSQDFGSYSLDGEINVESIAGSWTRQQSGCSQPRNKPHGWNVESVSLSGVAAPSNHENENPFQHSQSNYQKRVMHEEGGQGSGIWKANSVPYSTSELEPEKAIMESPLVNREGFTLNDAVSVPNSRTTRVDEKTSQFLPNSRHLNYWKHVDSSVKSKGSESMGKSQHSLNRGRQDLESLNCSDKVEVKMHEMGNCNRKENSSDSCHLSHHSSAGSLRENILSDASDSRTLPGGKQKLSNHVVRKSSGPPKFQYHPMGNLDEDVKPSYEAKQAVSQQNAQGLKSQDQGYFGQSNFFGQIPKTVAEMGKAQLPDLLGDTKVFDHVPPFDRSVDINAANKASQSSQIMELLHKVDQSREHGTMMHFSSSEYNPSSEMPEAESSGGSASHLQQSQSSASQGFSLQLGPPSQWLPVQNRALSSQSSEQTISVSSLIHAFPEIKEMDQMRLASTALFQSSTPSHQTFQGEFRNNRIGLSGQTGSEASLYKMPGNFSSAFSSCFPYSSSQLQNQHMAVASVQVSTNQSTNLPVDMHASLSKQTDGFSRALTGQSAMASLPDGAPSVSYDNPASSGDISQQTSVNHPHERVLGPQQGAFSKMLPNAWTNVPAHQNKLDARGRKFPSKFSQAHQSDIVESSLSAQQHIEDEDVKKGGNIPSESGASSVNSQGILCGEEEQAEGSSCQKVSSSNIDVDIKTNESQRKEPVTNNLSTASPANLASTQSDIEAFGRSLIPHNSFHQNYSLLDQMQIMKNTGTDPRNRGLKRLKGLDSSPSVQQVAPKIGQSNECNSMAGDELVCRSALPSGDSKMLSFSGPGGNLERNAPSQGMLAFDQSDSQNRSCSNNIASVRVEDSKISVQMAPSWFDQYGTFKNRQILPVYDAQQASTVKTMEHLFTLGKSSGGLHALNSMEQVNAATDTSQDGNFRQSSTPASVAVEHFSSPQSLLSHVSGQHLVVPGPKKRKNATSELHPWHKEVLQDSRSLQTISMAEVYWAKAANRLTEKVEDEAEMIEDAPSMLRSKRRLILTTQLMQQLFRPPPATVLTADASSNYGSVAYFVTRVALGDACSLISCPRSDFNVQANCTNFLSDKGKMSGKIEDQHLSKVLEDFLAKARKIENDFLRLDKRASISDLRLECQDLEKFSVINRFAKFHGRGQADGAETSLSSDIAANVQKPGPQRYVSALPVPRNLPDRVQCLSL